MDNRQDSFGDTSGFQIMDATELEQTQGGKCKCDHNKSDSEKTH